VQRAKRASSKRKRSQKEYIPKKIQRSVKMQKQQFDEYRPTEDEAYMCWNHREYFKERLMAWRMELVATSEIFFEGLKENGNRASDPLDQSALQTEMYLDLTTRERQQKVLQDIDLALARIEAGTYGYCEITEEEIGLKRLIAQPLATRCIEAQKEFERLAVSKSHMEGLAGCKDALSAIQDMLLFL
jgi:DnaK suppressor protein